MDRSVFVGCDGGFDFVSVNATWNSESNLKAS